ncbi:MAG TPA: SMI1/KNR4 family protein [Flavobacterium sp.]|jgi:hypothetical protein
MNIEYMTEVQNNMKIERKPWPNKGLSISQIEDLEKKYNRGREFPKAFREFLYLAGENNNFAFDDLGEGLDELQELAKEELEMAGQKVDRPFFAFSVYNSCYYVIFLDETKEDPKVYLIMPFLAEGGSEPLIKSNGWDFTALVNESIHRVKNNIPF